MSAPWRRRLRPGAAAYHGARRPGVRTPWDVASWCVVDLELSGLDPRRHDIVSFGAVPIEHGRIQLAEAVSGLVRPSRPVAAHSILIHGIRAEDLVDAPALADAIDPLLAAMAGRALVAHVARIETAFLGRALRRQRLRVRGPVADTSAIGRLWLSERDGVAPANDSLAHLARVLALPAYAEHDALGDALTAAQVFIAAATHLHALRPETVRSITSARQRLDTAARYPAVR